MRPSPPPVAQVMTVVCPFTVVVIQACICVAFIGGLHLYAGGYEHKGPFNTLAQSMEGKASVQTPTVGSMQHSDKIGPPAHVLLLMHPKTGSGSVSVALRKTGRWREPRMHCPWKDGASSFVKGLGCNRSAWCLVISGVRKLGRVLASSYFQTYCRNVSKGKDCRERVLELNDAELAKEMVEYMRRRLRHYEHWWSLTHDSLRDAGLRLDMRNIGRDGFASSPNALWLVLRFEEIRDHERILKSWLPGISFEDLPPKPITARAYYPQYLRMMKHFENVTSWPSHVLSQVQASESMRLFYPGAASIM